MEFVELKRWNGTQIRAAGPRYTPGLDASAPNVEIDSLLGVLDALAFNHHFRDRVSAVRADLEAAMKHARRMERDAFRRRVNTPSGLMTELGRLRSLTDPQRASTLVRSLRHSSGYVLRTLDHATSRWRDELEALGTDSAVDAARRALDGYLHDARTVRGPVQAIDTFMSGPQGTVLVDNRALCIRGSWGTGKTHLLCDYTLRRTSEGLPALLVLAHELPTDNVSPLDAIAQLTSLAPSGAKLIRALNAYGKAMDARALLIVDGINESDREFWRRALRSLALEVDRFRNVRLVVSCREPFERQLFTSQSSKRFASVVHYGFTEQEFDAQLEFFTYYGIPAPGFPLLTPEFSRPLFLKLLCESIRKLSKKTQRRTFRQIAAGHKGMTYVLEHFVKNVGRPIEDDFKLTPGSCWRILKGGSGGGLGGLAELMADTVRDWLTHGEARDCIAQATGLARTESQRLLRRLITDGLLVETIHWSEGSQEDAVQFPYQRFGDHLIARHLLARHLDTSSPERIRRCFYANRPLGNVFRLDRWGHEFELAGIAAAVMLEFPERMKRLGEGELVQYLPKRSLFVGPLRDVFLQGLHWRSSDSFNEHTDRLVSFFREHEHEPTRNETLAVLIELACRPDHPYSARRLLEYLARQPMAERDLGWTEFLRKAYEGSTIYRILAWFERHADVSLDLPSTTNAFMLLQALLTTNNRHLRDRVTRALFLLGLRHPAELFEATMQSLDFNDPYVPERMLAAAYGVAINHWADPRGEMLRSTLPDFAKQLVREMFRPNAPSGTRHELMRGYALGLISLARRVAPNCIATRHVPYLRPPFDELPNPFPDENKIRDRDVEDAEHAIHMDFGNYTIGHLLDGRENYDFKHNEYATLRRQIAWRIHDLGFRWSSFEDIDRAIARWRHYPRDDEPELIDRYGKKYAWIAYFEMYGLRQDAGALPEWRAGERSSDCDIDPSFPTPPKEWNPSLPRIFDHAPSDPVAWLRGGPKPGYRHLLHRRKVDGIDGPWVLLDGYIQQDGGDLLTWTLLRSVFVRFVDVGDLRRRLRAEGFPGNHRIPDAASDYYTYAGEIPWSPRFASYVRRWNGSATRHVDEAFRTYGPGGRKGIRVEVPSHTWAWESYHSALNQVSGVLFPAPAVCEALGLVNHSRTFDLYDMRGRVASLYREFGSDSSFLRSQLLYLREDLVRRYLAMTNQRLVWIPWGERSLATDLLLSGHEGINAARTENANVFRSFHTFGQD